MLSGDNGVLQRATDAKTRSDESQIQERVRLAYNSALTRDLTNGNGALTKDTLEEEISNEFGVDGSVTEDDNYFIISVKGNEIEKIAKVKNNTTPTEPETPTDKLAVLEAKIKDEDDDCMIDENENIYSINIYKWKEIDDETCEILGSEDEDYGGVESSALNQTSYILADGTLQYDIPVFVKKDNKIYKMTKIGFGALSDSRLKNVNIPKSVTIIDDDAFYKCRSLLNISIPNSVTSIGTDAFYDCTSLSSITIPSSVTSIKNSAFSGCTGLSSIVIPNTMLSLGHAVFDGWISSQTIDVPFKEGEAPPSGWNSSWFSGCNAQINYAN